MGVNDVVILGPSDDMNVSIGDDDGFGVVREILELVKLLNLVVLVVKVVQEAVILLDGKDRHPGH
jgi:hypothetical protein